VTPRQDTIAADPEIGAALALLEAQIASGVRQRSFPGMSMSIVLGPDTIWIRGFGSADIERNVAATPDTVYAVGSITKLFTATMLMQLRDRGKLRLDDAVQDYVPDIRVPKRHADAPPITFRHLVTHTSGLAKDAPVEYWATNRFPPVERLMELLAETEQPYPPASQWKYSNLAIALLGHTLSRIAGESWDSYVDRHILSPLGMTNTAPRLTDRVKARTATGYARPTGGWPPSALPHQELGGISFGGSLHSSVADMAKFMAEQFSSAPKLLSRSSILEMQRLQWLNDDWQTGQGIGWRVHRAADGSTRIEHGGGVYGFTCKLLLSPADRLGSAVFTNGSDGAVGLTWSARALDLLAPIVRQRRVEATGRAADSVPEAWYRYVGRYRWVLGDMEIAVRGGELVLMLPNGLATEEVRLQPEAEHVFRMPGGNVRGERLRFVADGSGRVARAWVGPHPHDRI
jgi:CubicO group peptidase (beta-lactamase class C family)